MYWYKPSRIFIIFITIAGLQACRPGVDAASANFFDLKGFFEADSSRLTRLNPLVNKTAKHNGKTETKRVHIKNWGEELALFINSDINKPAWKSSYATVENDTIVHYKAIEPELKTREIVIKKLGKKIMSIGITNHTENFLYTNTEKLIYYPDSLYRINKTQQVRLIGKNVYVIEGRLAR
ncbi:hypothetical protein DJ568_01175 [Mucilaginibacter hurinus]|uniref:Uncharacterized protein n=1 Tax=Mucilaginibacter hurinus TaxID=2201324 RepID=A0A367GSU3_9SPHI|nr:hypothetical protein [Mucilaginibacter hurinus]RCH56499.1 hypothetical protein DJ568_01175 [Mucilaginibacter hurinus]